MTTLQSALEKLLEPDTLDAFVRGRRNDGQSWRVIAIALYDATGLSITHETLRAWYPDNGDEEAA